MTLHHFKPYFQALLRPLARWIVERGGTANLVTLIACLGSVALGVVLWTLGPRFPASFLLLPPWLLARMALNALDGLLAREHRQASAFGAYLNELADVVADAACVLPFVAVPPCPPTAVVLVALLASWTELAGVLGPTVGARRRYEGPMGKSDRALVLGVLGGWLGWTGALPAWTALVFPAMAVLCAWTVRNRVVAGLREARR